MPTCPTCAADVRGSASFCEVCGARLASDADETTADPARFGGGARRSASADLARPPGTLLGHRYRLVGRLGRGGMGEVYGADDLKLDHPVALKFLPPALAADPAALARLHNEVRVARQVSHPNVCRIFDIVEADGEHFLTMEYVDGEDLASLLRRIGRLPGDKAVEMARQLCAGLSAAHDAGVVHRDLKPANVMIDGRGRVKITDFGVADVAERFDRHEVAGTPAYVAPEQLAGHTATTRSDLYALGLVLYEAFTGRAVFEAKSFEARTHLPAETTPPAPTSIVADLNPAVERVIMRCLDSRPEGRPPSAVAVAAALPGGDPLAAALAAGETPSPEMVAASGEVGSIRPVVAWAWAALIVTLLGLSAAWAPGVSLVSLAGLEQHPMLLRERARSVLAHAGYGASHREWAAGFDLDLDTLLRPETRTLLDDWARVFVEERPTLTYWYRESPRTLIPWQFAFRPTMDDPPVAEADARLVQLDAHGHLRRLLVVPAGRETVSNEGQAPAWAALFREAGYDLSRFTEATPLLTPPTFADTRLAWLEALPDPARVPLRVEAAARRGRPVSFLVTAGEPGDPDGADAEPFWLFTAVVLAVFALIFVGSAALAWRNLKVGRADRRGAGRVAIVVFLLALFSHTAETRHVLSLDEAFLFLRAVGASVWMGVAVWTLYLAVEPFVRRRWPELIVSWSRLLAGRLRDPLVGRDVLVGGALGAATHFTTISLTILAREAGWAVFPLVPELMTLLGSGTAAGVLGRLAMVAFSSALLFMALLVVLTVLLRRRALAIAAFFVIVYVIFASGAVTPFERVAALLPPFISVLLVVRLGMLAILSFHVFLFLAQLFPLTLDVAAPYADASGLALTCALALTLYGLHTSLGGRLFGAWTLTDE